MTKGSEGGFQGCGKGNREQPLCAPFGGVRVSPQDCGLPKAATGGGGPWGRRWGPAGDGMGALKSERGGSSYRFSISGPSPAGVKWGQLSSPHRAPERL